MEGQKLKADGDSFRLKLNTQVGVKLFSELSTCIFMILKPYFTTMAVAYYTMNLWLSQYILKDDSIAVWV